MNNSITFKELKFKDKIDHIWTYYRIQIVVVVFSIVAVVSLLNHFVFNPPPRIGFGVTFFGAPVPMFINDSLREEMENIIPEWDNSRQMLDITNVFESGNISMDMAVMQRFTAMLFSGEVDILLVYTDALEEVFKNRLASDLRLILPDGYFEAIDETLIVYGNVSEVDFMGEVVAILYENAPLGLSLYGNAFFQELAEGNPTFFDNWNLVIVGNTGRLDFTLQFLAYIGLL